MRLTFPLKTVAKTLISSISIGFTQRGFLDVNCKCHDHYRDHYHDCHDHYRDHYHDCHDHFRVHIHNCHDHYRDNNHNNNCHDHNHNCHDHDFNLEGLHTTTREDS